MKLNERRPEALPFLWQGLGCVLIFILGILIYNANITLISGLAYLISMMSGIAALCFFFPLAIWFGITNTAHSGYKAIALRVLPGVPPAIMPTPELFDVKKIPRVSRESPTISKDFFTHFDNQAKLRSHVNYLNEIHAKIIEFLKPAPVRYAADQVRVENQQLALYRMAHQAAGMARKTESTFPKLKADLAAVPQPKSVALPVAPKLQSLKNLDQQNKNFSAASGRAIAQGASQGGIAGAVVAVVATAAIGVIAQQKQIRAMEDAHGSLKAFISRAKDDIKLLGLAHQELVDTSNEIYRQSVELRNILIWAKAADGQGKFKPNASLTADEKTKVLKLSTYAMIARIDAAKAV